MGPLPVGIPLKCDSILKSVQSCPPTLRELTDAYVQRVLEICEGHPKKAARILGIGRTTLYRYLDRKKLELLADYVKSPQPRHGPYGGRLKYPGLRFHVR